VEIWDGLILKLKLQMLVVVVYLVSFDQKLIPAMSSKLGKKNMPELSSKWHRLKRWGNSVATILKEWAGSCLKYLQGLSLVSWVMLVSSIRRLLLFNRLVAVSQLTLI
jgi:hypothetical protein